MMTSDQFNAIAQLLRMQDSPSRQAARMVLIDGASVGEAAKASNITSQAVSRALRSIRTGIDLARAAVETPPTPL